MGYLEKLKSETAIFEQITSKHVGRTVVDEEGVEGKIVKVRGGDITVKTKKGDVVYDDDQITLKPEKASSEIAASSSDEKLFDEFKSILKESQILNKSMVKLLKKLGKQHAKVKSLGKDSQLELYTERAVDGVQDAIDYVVDMESSIKDLRDVLEQRRNKK